MPAPVRRDPEDTAAFRRYRGHLGSSFLFIRLAVEHMPPAWVVFGRTLLGAAFLVPLAVWPPASDPGLGGAFVYPAKLRVDDGFTPQVSEQPLAPFTGAGENNAKV
jgi:hypothetical protein